MESRIKQTLVFLMFFPLCSMSMDVTVVMTCQPNSEQSIGNTYRLYAVLPPESSLHVVYGDVDHPLSVISSTPFFQHAMGSNTSAGIHPAVVSSQPDLSYDSWITLGYENQIDNHLWDVGLELNSFAQGGNIFCDNGGWFLVPTDQRTIPNEQGLILLGQFTSTGTVSGVLNLQGKSPSGIWNQTGLTFSSDNCLLPGCTDPEFSNYNPLAQINDGSCSGNGIVPTDVARASIEDWDLFPNPLRENLIHIQLGSLQFLSAEKAILEIRDGSGKSILSYEIQPENLKEGNRLTIEYDLSSGVYEVIIHQGKSSKVKKIVVVK
jgi:hypothetical protein